MADHLGGEPFVAAGLAKLVGYAPAFVGAVLSLAFVDALTVRGRLVAVAVGFCSAIFLAPLVLAVWGLFWPGDMPEGLRGGVSFLVGLSAIGVLPPFLKWLKRLAGDPLSLLRTRIGPPPPVEGGEA